MDIVFSVGLLAYVLARLFPKDQVNGTRYFDSKSKNMYKQMKDDGLSEQSLKEFADMQDLMLEYQHSAVYDKIDRSKEVKQLSEQIKKRFAGYDFSYHSSYIQQSQKYDVFINPVGLP
jgi:hypothetical protein